MTTFLKKDEYFHGTDPLAALQIVYEGFVIKKRFSRWGRFGTFGQALYLTQSLETAGTFGQYIFRCKLIDATRILRLDGVLARKTIESMRREFGQELLSGDISKVVPRNKHLKKTELIALLNYRICKMGDTWSDVDVQKWDQTIGSVRSHLMRHKYDGIGDPSGILGIAVLNPSRIVPLDLHQMSRSRELEALKVNRFIADITQDLKWLKEYLDHNALAKNDLQVTDLEGMGQLLHKYCQENKIFIHQ